MPVHRLLVIDDDASVQRLFNTLLTRAGFSVESATEGREGLAMLDRNDYDVVILDLMMPVMNGFEVIDALALSKPEMLRKVIVATAAGHRLLDRFDASRIHALIRKPFDIDHVISAALSCVNATEQ